MSTGFWRRRLPRSVERMAALIIILLILGLVFGVFGFVVKGLIWLAIIGIVLIVVSAIWGFIRRGSSRA
jgi:membrane-bound ClpP family serine protease